MNCSHVRDNLASLLYGDVPAAEKAEWEKHLAGCPSCRREYRALEEVRRLLDTQVAPEVTIDFPRLYRQAAEQQERRLHRWRRAAVLVTGVAALFAVLAFGLRLEARVESHQLVLRWGSPPPVPEATLPEPAPKTLPGPDLRTETQLVRTEDEQLRLLSQLIHALADDVQVLERQKREDASQFQARLQAFQQQNVQRCADLQRSIDGLYVLFHKGE